MIRRLGLVKLWTDPNRLISRCVIEGPALTIGAVLIYGAIHSLLARKKIKTSLINAFGPLAERGYRLFYNAFSVVSFLPVLLILGAFPGHEIYQLSGILLIAALILQFFSVVAIMLTLLKTGIGDFLGTKQLMINGAERSIQLVTDGPYRWVRHPLYTFGLIFIWATPILTTSVLALNISLTIYVYIGSVFEERRLMSVFGVAYEEYAKRVPRLVPRIGFPR